MKNNEEVQMGKLRQVKMPVELPQTDEPKKVKPKVNCLQDMLIEIMNERGLRDADIVREAGIPAATVSDWTTGVSEVQYTDTSLFKLFTYLKVPLHYLVYGIGSGELDDDSQMVKSWKDDDDFWHLQVGPKTFKGTSRKHCIDQYNQWVLFYEDDIA